MTIFLTPRRISSVMIRRAVLLVSSSVSATAVLAPSVAKASGEIILCEPFNPPRPVTCGFGCYSGHAGLDYGDKAEGANILSPINGTVTFVKTDSPGQTCTPDFGNYVKIVQGDFEVILAHMKSDTPLTKGPVSAGQLAGHLSNTGYTINGQNQCQQGGAYHLHLEVRQNGTAIDPKNSPLIQWGGPDCGGPSPCSVSAQSTTTIEDDQGCLERGGESWWSADDGSGHSYTTYATDAPVADSYGKYRLSFAAAGNYQVEACVPALQNLSKKATYQVWAAGTAHAVLVDQTKAAGQCVSLGSFAFAAGGAQYVQLNDNTGEKFVNSSSAKIAFDAIRVTPAIDVGACATPPCDQGTGGSSGSAGAGAEEHDSSSAPGCSTVPTADTSEPNKASFGWLLLLTAPLLLRRRTNRDDGR